MRVAVTYALHSQGCGPVYSIEAFTRLGHDVTKMNVDEFVASNPDDYDWFFCQDSGEGIDFRRVTEAHLKKTTMWYWDSAWNHRQRNPGDDEMAAHVSENGGWVFHTWQSDLVRCSRRVRIDRQSLLPVAGDPYLWPDEPREDKQYDLSMVGNCYDPGRGNAINYARDHCSLYWPGPNSNFFQDAASIYRSSWAVLHIPTFWRLPHDVTGERVDLMQGATMRHYEALCCGAPLVTTRKSDFDELGFRESVHYFVWEELDQMPEAARRAKETAQMGGAEYAQSLRQFILDHHTYEHRIEDALVTIRRAGMLKELQ